MTEHFVMNLSPSLSESLQLSSFPPSLLLLMLFWCTFIPLQTCSAWNNTFGKHKFVDHFHGSTTRTSQMLSSTWRQDADLLQQRMQMFHLKWTLRRIQPLVFHACHCTRNVQLLNLLWEAVQQSDRTKAPVSLCEVAILQEQHGRCLAGMEGVFSSLNGCFSCVSLIWWSHMNSLRRCTTTLC